MRGGHRDEERRIVWAACDNFAEPCFLGIGVIVMYWILVIAERGELFDFYFGQRHFFRKRLADVNYW